LRRNLITEKKIVLQKKGEKTNLANMIPLLNNR